MSTRTVDWTKLLYVIRIHGGITKLLRGMEVSDSILLPMSKVTTIRASASHISMEMNREYRTATDNQEEVIRVIRVLRIFFFDSIFPPVIEISKKLTSRKNKTKIV